MKLFPVFGGIVLACVPLLSPLVFGGGLCEGVPHAGVVCSSGGPNVVTETVLPQTAALLLRIVAGLSVLFIVWGGILMLISMGDDAKTAQAKWAIVYALLGLFGAVLSQVFVGFVAKTPLGAGATEATVIQQAVKFLVNAMNVVFITAIIFAGIRMLLGHGQPEEFTRAKKVIAWAILGALVVNVARTLVRAVLSLRMSMVPHVFAAGVGMSLSQYQGKVCGAGFAPAWMCGISGVVNVSSALGRVTGFVTGLAAGVGVCVFIYACIRIVASQGQDDKMAAAKKTAIIALIGVFLALSANAIVGALWADGGDSILKTIFGL